MVVIYPSSPREAAKLWLGGSPYTRAPKQANINAIVRLLATNKPVSTIKKAANKIVATQRRGFTKAVRGNIGRRRQKRTETILTGRAGLRNSGLSDNVIRSIAKHLTTRRRA
jgi:hypothetical protein